MIESHDRSQQHRKSFSDMIIRKSKGFRIDNQLVDQFESECNYWNEVIMRCVNVIKFLSKRGLPFRGKDEQIGSVQNGNFWEL